MQCTLRNALNGRNDRFCPCVSVTWSAAFFTLWCGFCCVHAFVRFLPQLRTLRLLRTLLRLLRWMETALNERSRFLDTSNQSATGDNSTVRV